jgi:nucleoside 2-deoxyribosyltransferase
MRAHFICPVRGVSPEVQAEIDAYAEKLVASGWEVHNPKYAVDQSDPTGYNICMTHLNSMKMATRVFVFWDANSKGSHFDLGMAFALGKPLTLVRLFQADEQGKSFVKVIEEVTRREEKERVSTGKPKVYLAGPIENCTKAEVEEWREYATIELDKMGYDVLNPIDKNYRELTDRDDREIVEENKREIQEADYILANYFKASTGTSMEIFMAWGMGKPVIVVASGRINPWLRYHAREVVGTLEDAFAVFKNLMKGKEG